MSVVMSSLVHVIRRPTIRHQCYHHHRRRQTGVLIVQFDARYQR
jgi:hypothetical protein